MKFKAHITFLQVLFGFWSCYAVISGNMCDLKRVNRLIVTQKFVGKRVWRWQGFYGTCFMFIYIKRLWLWTETNPTLEKSLRSCFVRYDLCNRLKFFNFMPVWKAKQTHFNYSSVISNFLWFLKKKIWCVVTSYLELMTRK